MRTHDVLDGYGCFVSSDTGQAVVDVINMQDAFEDGDLDFWSKRFTSSQYTMIPTPNGIEICLFDDGSWNLALPPMMEITPGSSGRFEETVVWHIENHRQNLPPVAYVDP